MFQCSSQACKARKIKCDGTDAPPCKGCKASNLVCELPDRQTRRKRSHPVIRPFPQPQLSASPSYAVDTLREALPASLERRLRRIERALDLDAMSASTVSGGEHEDAVVEDEIIAPPRFQLGGQDHPVYHGETSMHEDIASPSKRVKVSTAGLDVSSWTTDDLRALTRLRHRYATAEEGEAWMDAYFNWASVTYAIVNRHIFLREPACIV